MRYISYCISTFLLLFILSSCGSESTPVYSLTTSSAPEEAGSVSPTSGEYDEGETVEITATPNDDWVFESWEGDASGSDNPTSITIDGDKDIAATFVLREYPLTIETDGEGTVTEQILQEKTTDYEVGTTVELTANPAEGWEFVEWSGDLAGSENPETITIEKETTVTAIFAELFYKVEISLDGEGTINETLIEGEESEGGYKSGSVVELSVTGSENYNFVHWVGGLDGTENPKRVTIQNDISATAVLGDSPFAGGNGSEEYPYLIENIDQLQSIDEYRESNFSQISNIDATETINWNNGKGFDPIGDSEIRFIGSYDGNNHEIRNLVINRPDGSVGIFESLGDSKIVNLKIIDANVHGIGGILFGGGRGNITIENISITGKIVGGSGLGGSLMNRTQSNKAIIENIFLDVEVSSPGHAGGLFGRSEWNVNIANVKSIGDVEGGRNVGGLIGYANYGTSISNSSAHGNVVGDSYVGGLVGNLSSSTISDSHAFGNVTGEEDRVGGIAGYFHNISWTSYIENASSNGKIQGENFVGGLVGFNYSLIRKSVNNSNVYGNNYVGGIAGTNQTHSWGYFGVIENTYSSGSVNGDTQVGGMVGRNQSDNEIRHSFSYGEVKGEEDTGSLIGINGGILEVIYCNTEINASLDCVGRGYTSGISELATSQLTGTSAEENMPEFDWDEIWMTVSGDYPILRWQE